MNQLYGAEDYYKIDLTGVFVFNPEVEVEIHTFPGGEPHVKLRGNLINTPYRIYQRIRKFEDLGVLLMTVNAIRNKVGSNIYISLVLPYFPGARQDRVAPNVIEPFTVKVYADLINSLNLDQVIIFDPHSDVAPALINNCTVLTNTTFFEIACIDEKFEFVCPDAGAVKKLDFLTRELGMDDWQVDLDSKSIIYCKKHRDMATGKLSNFSIDGEFRDLTGIDCIIVDDICDGGGTFIEIAKLLKARGARKLHLIVSHGIFSKGTNELKNYFSTISTTNSWCDIRKSLPGVQVYDLISMYQL